MRVKARISTVAASVAAAAALAIRRACGFGKLGQRAPIVAARGPDDGLPVVRRHMAVRVLERLCPLVLLGGQGPRL